MLAAADLAARKPRRDHAARRPAAPGRTLELTGTDERVDACRVDAIVAAVRRAILEFGERRTPNVWRGLRPCMPDGLPVIGRVPELDNAILATGHGMWGLQLAPLTGQPVSAMAAGDEPDQVLHALRPDRFTRRV